MGVWQSLRFLLLVIGLVTLAGCASSPELVDVTEVEYQHCVECPETGWTQVALRQTIPGHPTLPTWLRVHPPALQVTDPAIRINSGVHTTEARQGDRRMATVGAGSILPLDGSGRPVLVRLSVGRVSFGPQVKAGSQRALWVNTIALELPAASTGIAILVAGMLLLAAGLRRGGSRAYRGLGTFFTCVALIQIINMRQLSLFLPGDGGTKILVHSICSTLYPVGFAEFVCGVFGDGPWKLIRRGLRVYAGGVALAAVLHLAGVVEYRVSRDYFALFVLLVCVQGIVLAARRARDGDSSARTFLWGIGVLTTGLIDVLGWFDFQVVSFALPGFSVAMVLVLERQFSKARDDIQVFAGELARKVEALEERNREVQNLNQELRHQIAARSKQLVHVLQWAPSMGGERMKLSKGDLIGNRYSVVRRLGEGGMGEVFEVQRLTDGRHLALKLMSGQVSATSAARFAREAEIAARVAHDNLVPVVDIGGEQTGGLYLVMELVKGTSLEDGRERFGDVPWALGILSQVAGGLAALHAAGVVHRDLKPANVLLSMTDDGSLRARIADFGISHLGSDALAEDSSLREWKASLGSEAAPMEFARTIASAQTAPEAGTLAVSTPPPRPGGEAASVPPAAELTSTGMIMGTPAYMAPEAAFSARSARPASDMFAFGLMAYEMLGGSAAFDIPPGFLAMKSGRLPPVRPLAAEVSEAVRNLVHQCLRLEADERPTAEEAVRVLTG